jgi:anti-sigma regulatory factor (Ser/Thr protein kinase)
MAGDRPEGVEVVTLSIPSRLDLLSLVDRVTDSISERMEFDDEQRAAISLSVIEAGTNAIQHGHGSRAALLVSMRFEMHPDRLAVIVHDDGPGFPPPDCPADPTSPEHLFDSRGRGIFIMRTCMDDVGFDFGTGGTTVRLTKLRRPSTNGTAATG